MLKNKMGEENCCFLLSREVLFKDWNNKADERWDEA